MSEHQVAAHFEYLCAREGSQRLAYVPVVASGWAIGFSAPRRDEAHIRVHDRPNALVIHYTSNNQLIDGREMILMDAGCELK